MARSTRLSFIVLLFLLTNYGCGFFPDRDAVNSSSPVPQDIEVTNPISLEGDNQIIFAKVNEDIGTHKYSYWLENGVCIVSNDQWYIGDFMQFYPVAAERIQQDTLTP